MLIFIEGGNREKVHTEFVFYFFSHICPSLLPHLRFGLTQYILSIVLFPWRFGNAERGTPANADNYFKMSKAGRYGRPNLSRYGSCYFTITVYYNVVLFFKFHEIMSVQINHMTYDNLF